MADMVVDVNLFWGCSGTRCIGGYLELRERKLTESCRKLHNDEFQEFQAESQK